MSDMRLFDTKGNRLYLTMPELAGAMCNACGLRVVLDSETELRSTVSFRLPKQRTTSHRIISQRLVILQASGQSRPLTSNTTP